MYGQDILCGTSKVSFEIPHKISCPYIARCVFLLTGENLSSKILELIRVFEMAHWIAPCIRFTMIYNRDQCRCAPSQWETSLQCNDVSHWLGAYLHWSLFIMWATWITADGLRKEVSEMIWKLYVRSRQISKQRDHQQEIYFETLRDLTISYQILE